MPSGTDVLRAAAAAEVTAAASGDDGGPPGQEETNLQMEMDRRLVMTMKDPMGKAESPKDLKRLRLSTTSTRR